MQGRLETKIKIEKNIQKILIDCPKYLIDYYLSLSSKEPTTCLEYIRKVKNFLTSMNNNINKIKINEIRDTDISKYLKNIEMKEINGEYKETSFAYRKQNYSALVSFFNYLHKKNYFEKNPMDLIERPTTKDEVKRIYLTEKQLRKIIKYVNFGAGSFRAVHRQESWKERDKAILLTLMTTGMRETALCEININDIDFNDNSLRIIDKGHKTHIYKMNDILKSAILDWVRIRKSIIINQNDALFLSNRKARITPDSVANIVKKYSEEAIGIAISPHKLRASYCNILLKKTGDIYFVSKAVGHSNISTTELYLDDNIEYNRIKASSIMENVFEI